MTSGNPRKPGDHSNPTRSERWSKPSDETRPVRLIRKYAEMIDGVDLGDATVGDRLELPPRDADVLIAEGWAVPDAERRTRVLPRRAMAADRSHGPRKKPGN